MSGMLSSVITWLITSGIKVLGILIAFVILLQMSKWIMKWLEKFIPEKDSLQAISFIALLMILGVLGIQLDLLLATAGIGAVAIGFGAQSLAKVVSDKFESYNF